MGPSSQILGSVLTFISVSYKHILLVVFLEHDNIATTDVLNQVSPIFFAPQTSVILM